MRAVAPHDPDRSGEVRLVELPDPVPAAGEVRIRVAATAINHADLLQLRGLYPPPPGASDVPGLECAGTVDAVGSGVEFPSPGDRVMALLAGGGHGELVTVPVGQVMPVPEGMELADAASLPESAITAWTNLVAEGGLEAGETVLVTGATGGVGTFAVQLARELGARVLASARNLERLERCLDLGADTVVRASPDLADSVRAATGSRGVDLVLDLVGGELLPAHLAALAPRGRLVLVGLLAGQRAELDLARVLRRRLRIVGSVLRAREAAEKADLIADFHVFAADRLADGRLHPVVGKRFPFERIGEAYQAVREGGTGGKVVVTLPSS